MRNPFQSSPALRGVCLVSLAALSLLSGCGRLRRWYARTQKESNGRHSVTITWAPSKSAVAGYYVYRFSSPDDLARVSSGIVAATQYTDKTVEGGKTYTYYVKSLDSRGIESAPSEKITVKVPGGWLPPLF
jgi:fibronectin type 3 domain-containing protein